MASLGGEQLISTNSQSEPAPIDRSREGSVERKARDREEKLRLAKERQNEERQKKIEELKAQAEAAQKYREQKEEERKRRIEEIRLRDTEKRQQVEERKKAIIEAEKERREYILRKNQEREARLEVKKRDRNSIGFAFGSSTPRLLEPADFGTVSPSIYWGHRRSTSITNVAYTGAPLSRRSSERELADGSKKRATSASGADRHDDHRRKSSSMYEVFNWGYSNDEPPKRFSLSIVGSEINIGEPPTTTKLLPSAPQCSAPRRQYSKNIFKEDNVDTAHIAFRSVARRKTDLMPTIPSPRDTHYGSKSSLSTTPRTPGRAFSMNRLDQLAQPIRRNGEHIRAIVERERQHQLEMLMETESLDSSTNAAAKRSRNHHDGGSRKNMSRSMTHLVSSGHTKLSHSKHIDSVGSAFRPLNEMECKVLNQITARRKTTQSSISTGYRSGDVTPGGSNNTSRPGSAMSTSTNMSMSGYVHRRPATTPRKPRPASIAGTGVSLDEINKQREKHRTPVKNSNQTTPKRSSLMTTSTSSSRVSSVERKTPAKKDVAQTRVQTTPKSSLLKTSSSEKLKDKAKDMTQSLILENPKTKDEKNALNVVKTEEASEQQQQQQVVTVDSSPSDVDTETKSMVETVISNNAIETEVAEEKADQGTEKEIKKEGGGNNSKEGSVVREVQLLSDKQEMNDMSASMIAKSKITTEEEAKAALAERRRVAREEAERQAELERQRLEAERLAEIKRQEEEAERERKFEEEATRLAQEQRKAEEERLRQAIEEVRLREEEERLRREEEEKQRVEREEAEKKAKEEAEKQKIEVAERLKREEKEREERRKRVEAIMSRTRKAGSANTPNSTPVKESENSKAEKVVPPVQTPVTEVKSIIDDSIKSQTDVTATPITTATTESKENVVASNDNSATTLEPQNSQAMYEQSVMDKESALMKSFSAMIIDENTKNLHNLQQNQLVDVTNGKIPEFPSSEDLLHNTVANGNGHLENINNKNEINILQDVSSTNQLIDLSIESQDINNAVNFNNNNSLLATTTTLVNADSHENKEISLL
ncbi:MAP7 domain-containing protein 2 isoform X2 [Episyrphus balteatus]|uniref:MAP7 domain-containing protein 2 isoform X2 n=1 Tax=Episyrphus balteatus TaxID=286459 RepID=UPI0024852397|nr:MAP7 domain-containing protein 2 isoform X2 [Episyrphus balteatus]